MTQLQTCVWWLALLSLAVGFGGCGDKAQKPLTKEEAANMPLPPPPTKSNVERPPPPPPPKK